MNLKEIVNRPDTMLISIEECLFVIKEYIKIRKDVDINPIIDGSGGGIGVFTQLQKMTQIVVPAFAWLRSNQHLL